MRRVHAQLSLQISALMVLGAGCLPVEPNADLTPGGGPDGCVAGRMEWRACVGGEQIAECVDGRWIARGACEQRACAEGALERERCGLNGRGARGRECLQAAWTDWSSCEDPDVCEDEQTDEIACGPTGDGRAARRCEAGEWVSFGACVEAADCAEGASRAERCGLDDSGTRTSVCEGGAWSEWSPCEGEARCRDGDREAAGCDDDGRRERRCAAGAWGTWGPCTAPNAECPDQTTELAPCGLNGRGETARACEDGRWSEWSACADDDRCVDGAAAHTTCGLNDDGHQARSCADGRWSPWSACEDPAECREDATEQRACAQGSRSRACQGGRWMAWSACQAPDDCDDDDEDRRGCGLNGDGSQARGCAQGRWAAWGACVDDAECPNGAREQRPCGAGEGVEIRGCAQGRWAPWAACDGRRGRVLINEVLFDAAGRDPEGAFIELWGPPGAQLEGLSLAAVNGRDGLIYEVTELHGRVPADGYFLLAHPEAAGDVRAQADQLSPGANLQNGPDSLRLMSGETVLDAVAYGDFSAAVFAGEGRPAPRPTEGVAIARGPTHRDTDDNALDFQVAGPTPGR